MPVTFPFTLTNGTSADADQVMADLNALKTASDAASVDLALLGGVSDGVTRRGYATVATSQVRGTTILGDMATVGPSVAVTVPTNGLVAVLAQVTIASGSSTAEVHLVEDGVNLGPVIKQSVAGTYYTSQQDAATGTPPGSAGTIGKMASGWIVFPATAGARTYKLQYADNGAPGLWAFSARKLWVMTQGF